MTEVQISDNFWPYTRATTLEPSETADYVEAIRSFLSARACVRPGFSGADQRLAAQFKEQSVSLQQVENAITLGCSRKYVGLLNGSQSGPILSFQYFGELIAEADEQITPRGYWDYARPTLNKLETQWMNTQTAPVHRL